ncbi:MAG: VacJ family lipoprotein [Gammaproteobacteria bacterium]
MTHYYYLVRSILLSSVITGLFLLSGCSGMPEKQAGEIPAQHSVDDVVRKDVTYAIDVYDPWEGFNRGMYRFNAGFDKYLFLPVVSVYEAVLPDFVEDGISNVFSNIFEFTNFTNSLLQLKPRATGETLARFVINSTIGLAGLFDVAEKIGLHEHEEDFGQTLGHYGAGNGPFIVLPIVGPSNLRDMTGNIADSVAFSALDPFDFDDHSDRGTIFYGLNAIDRRHKIGFRYYDTGSPFEYELVRMLYTKKRELDIAR